MSPKDLEAIENIKWDPPFPYDPASGWKKSSINVKNYGRLIHSSKVRFRFLHCQVKETHLLPHSASCYTHKSLSRNTNAHNPWHSSLLKAHYGAPAVVTLLFIHLLIHHDPSATDKRRVQDVSVSLSQQCELCCLSRCILVKINWWSSSQGIVPVWTCTLLKHVSVPELPPGAQAVIRLLIEHWSVANFTCLM